MKIADILRTLAANLEHAQGGAPDPRIQNPAQMIDVVAVADTDEPSPNGTTASQATTRLQKTLSYHLCNKNKSYLKKPWAWRMCTTMAVQNISTLKKRPKKMT
jgi:hypothetical protein